MLEKSHNSNSKKFMQKVLLFIDSVLLDSVNSTPEAVNKTLINGVLNIRDAILSEIVRDGQVDGFNQLLQQREELKKNQKEIKKEDQKDSNQENKSDSDQKA
jgi:hypothetical protein